jgi:hypothetical protein
VPAAFDFLARVLLPHTSWVAPTAILPCATSVDLWRAGTSALPGYTVGRLIPAGVNEVFINFRMSYGMILEGERLLRGLGIVALV